MKLIDIRFVRDNDLGLLELDARAESNRFCLGFALFRIGIQIFISRKFS